MLDSASEVYNYRWCLFLFAIPCMLAFGEQVSACWSVHMAQGTLILTHIAPLEPASLPFASTKDFPCDG